MFDITKPIPYDEVIVERIIFYKEKVSKDIQDMINRGEDVNVDDVFNDMLYDYMKDDPIFNNVTNVEDE